MDLKPIVEVAYLNQENSWRYRSIVSYCYRRHIAMQTYVYPEELYHELTRDAHFAAYTMEQLEQDLRQLVEWKNLLPRQETGQARTIDDFKRRKFRYQCSPYTVAIERMVQGLKQAGGEFGGSLETTQFERLLQTLRRFFAEGETLPEAELNQTWQDLYGYFTTMVRNASDYLAHLKSSKVEERMMMESFIIYKEKFTQYLQDFVLGLQRCSYKIEDAFHKADPEAVTRLCVKLAAYQERIPRLDEKKSRAEMQAEYEDCYQSIRRWFLGTEYHGSELNVLMNETTETIRRIARFAQRLAEQQQSFRSRKHDYIYLAEWFQRCDTLDAAHALSAMLFGVAQTRHLYAAERRSEDMDAFIEDEAATEVLLQPRTNTYREKIRHGAVRDRSEEKEALLRTYFQKQKEHDAMIDQLIVDGRIELGALPCVLPKVRKTLLNWVARCMQQETRRIQTETGRKIHLRMGRPGRRVRLESDDGSFWLPEMSLEITAGRASDG